MSQGQCERRRGGRACCLNHRTNPIINLARPGMEMSNVGSIWNYIEKSENSAHGYHSINTVLLLVSGHWAHAVCLFSLSSLLGFLKSRSGGRKLVSPFSSLWPPFVSQDQVCLAPEKSIQSRDVILRLSALDCNSDISSIGRTDLTEVHPGGRSSPGFLRLAATLLTTLESEFPEQEWDLGGTGQNPN